eukprot:6853883-Lingulodinium_polyedra.AAC.1
MQLVPQRPSCLLQETSWLHAPSLRRQSSAQIILRSDTGEHECIRNSFFQWNVEIDVQLCR